MRRALLFGLSAAAFAGVGGGLFRALHPVNLLRDAEICLERGDLHTAQLDLDSYLMSHPHAPDALFRLGLVNLAQGNGVAAEHNLRLARDGGRDPRALILPLGRAYLLQHHFDAALTDFTQATAPPDEAAPILMVRALTFLALHQLPAARDAAAQAESLAPNDPDVGLAAARIDLAAGDLDGAQAVTSGLLARAPGAPDLLVLRADLILARGDAAGALRAARAITAGSPALLDAQMTAARALMTLRQDDAAAALLDQLLRAAPHAVAPRYLRAILAVRQHNFATSDAQLTELAPVIDQLPLGPYLRAVTDLARGKPAQAEEAAAANAARYPDDLVAAKLFALASLTRGKPDQAEAALQKWIDAGPPDADTLALRAQAQTLRGDGEKAVRSLTQAAALAPANTLILNRLAAAHLRLGDMTEGADALRQSLAATADQPAVVTTLVQADLAAGDEAGASAAVAGLRRSQGDSELVGILTGRIRTAALDFAGARDTYAQILRRFPDSRGATFGLIDLDARAGNTPAARARLTAWMRIHPTDRDGLAMLVDAWRHTGGTQGAIAACAAAHDADPADLHVISLLAQLYLDSAQPERAAAVLERAAASGNTQILDLRAEAQARLGHVDEAQRLLLEAIGAAPHDPGPRLALAALKWRQHDADGARIVLAAGLAALPGDARLLHEAVALERRTVGLAAALAKAAALAADPRQQPAAAFLVGRLLAASGDQTGAADAFLAAFRAAPSAGLVHEAAAALASSVHPDAAAPLLNGWVKTHSDDVPGFQMLASLAITSNQFGDARRWLELVLAAQPDNAIALNNLAWVALAEGDAVRARALAQRAYFIAPGPQTQDTLGWIIARQGDSATAVALLQQAASLRPSSTILYHEGFALNAVGRPDDARAALDRALGDSKPFDGRAEAVVLRRQLGQK